MEITSSAFADGAEIPRKYGYYNGNESPPFRITEIPEGTKTLALIMDDPDAMNVVKNGKKPYSKPFVHWVLYNLTTAPWSKTRYKIPESIPESIQLQNGSLSLPLSVDEWKKIKGKKTQRFHEFIKDAYGSVFGMFGANDFDEFAYGGPAPPNPHEPRFAGSPERHTYVFKVYALDVGGFNFYLDETDTPVTKEDVEKAMEGHIIEQTQLTGTYAP